MDLSSGVNQGAEVVKETDRVFRGASEVSVLVRKVLYRAASSSGVDGGSGI